MLLLRPLGHPNSSALFFKDRQHPPSLFHPSTDQPSPGLWSSCKLQWFPRQQITWYLMRMLIHENLLQKLFTCLFVLSRWNGGKVQRNLCIWALVSLLFTLSFTRRWRNMKGIEEININIPKVVKYSNSLKDELRFLAQFLLCESLNKCSLELF